MHQDPIGNKYWSRLFDDFPQWQIVLLEGDTVIGVGNTIPISWHQSLQELPDTGWDWAFETAMKQADQNEKTNALIGLQIAIAHTHQGKQLSGEFVKRFSACAQQHNFKQILISVRPTHKPRYPLTPIEKYIQRQTPEGLPFDPWLRLHVKLGGQIIRACPQAMNIPGTIAQWESWTDMKFPESGQYVIPHALVPIEIDCQNDIGTYTEPNVWVVHHI
jgi:hypothetical protein